MRHAVGALVLGVALAATAAPGGGIPRAHAAREALSGLLPGNPQEGSRLFVAKGCVRCHAVLGDGGTAGPDLDRLTLKRPLLELAGVMWNHSPKMDAIFLERGLARPAIEPEQMASLLAFLYSLGFLEKPGDAQAGDRLFAAKGCRTCHTLGGRGGTVGPRLDKYSRYTSPLYLATALWKHGPAMAKAMAEHKVPRPRFKDDDIPNLMAFIRASGSGVERVYARPGSPARGEELFREKRCVTCHALRGQGGKVGPDLGEPGRLKGSLTQIVGAMWNHGPRMWEKMAERWIDVPSLATEDLSDLVSYLYFFQFIDPPGDPARGRLVFRAKQCGNCHALRGGGKDVGPPLAEGDAPSTPLAIITAMWNHAGKMDRKMLEENLSWPALDGTELADLVAYILSERERAAPSVTPRQ